MWPVVQHSLSSLHFPYPAFDGFLGLRSVSIKLMRCTVLWRESTNILILRADGLKSIVRPWDTQGKDCGATTLHIVGFFKLKIHVGRNTSLITHHFFFFFFFFCHLIFPSNNRWIKSKIFDTTLLFLGINFWQRPDILCASPPNDGNVLSVSKSIGKARISQQDCTQPQIFQVWE